MINRRTVFVFILSIGLTFSIFSQNQYKEYHDWILGLSFRYRSDWNLERIKLETGRFINITSPDNTGNDNSAGIMFGVISMAKFKDKTPENVISRVMDFFGLRRAEYEIIKKAGTPALYMKSGGIDKKNGLNEIYINIKDEKAYLYMTTCFSSANSEEWKSAVDSVIGSIKIDDPIKMDLVGIILLLGIFGILLVLRIPITFALIISSIITCAYLKITLMTIVQMMAQGVMNFSLLAIPFFILAGGIMTYGGMTGRVINFSNILVGRFRGGLAQVNVLASMFFGGVSGSAVADVSSIGAMLIPMMDKKGYDTDYSVAVTVSSACQGIIIPPSHNMIIYAFAVGSVGAGMGLSIGRLFLGGLVPGIILGLFLMVISYIIAVRRNYPTERKYNLKEAVSIFGHAIIGLFTFVIIMGGILLGIFTATESAAIACVYAFLVTTFVYKTMNFKKLIKVFYSSLKTLAIVMSLIGAAKAFGHMLAILHVPALATQGLLKISDNPIILLLLINGLLIVLGCIMDMAPLIIIVTPILFPVVVLTLGMDPIQFGVMLLLNLGIGLCTPPVGSALFVGCAVGRIPIEKASKALLPFYVMMICVLLLITFIPFLSTSVPYWLMPLNK